MKALLQEIGQAIRNVLGLLWHLVLIAGAAVSLYYLCGKIFPLNLSRFFGYFFR